MPVAAEKLRTKFHISLNTSNLPAAVAFYRALFGLEPAKQYADYAKFEIEEPPVVFSLTPHVVTSGGVVSNLALEVAEPGVLRDIAGRLAAAGLDKSARLRSASNGEACTNLEVIDPDNNRWDLYVRGDCVEPPMTAPVAQRPAFAEDSTTAVWEHHLSHGWPEQIEHPDSTLVEVRLQGSFNADSSPEQRAGLIREAWRVLRPGGKIVCHALAADRAFPKAQPALPGLAALVARVPLESESIEQLQGAGFVRLQIVKLSSAPVFMHDGVEMREQKLVAWKPEHAEREELRQVCYRGPLAEVTDDDGITYRRGQWLTVRFSAWNFLRESAASEQFDFDQPQISK